MSKSVRVLLVVRLSAALLALGACSSIDNSVLSSFDVPASAGDIPSSVDPQPNERLIPVAKEHFRQGNYGHAARYYEKAVEVMPMNTEAWLGLAASYDRIRRFDLADKAYRTLASRIGDRPEYLNNVGYSYLLRGDLAEARRYFLKAYEIDPNNLFTVNNLKMLNDAARSARADRPER